MREADLQSSIIECATLYQWLSYHTHDARKSAKGFPDLVLVRERVIYAELKTEVGVPTPEQKMWAR